MTVLKTLCAVLGTVVAVCYFYQFVYLFLPFLDRGSRHRPEKLHRYAILIAARNEERVLPHLLESIRCQDYPAELITTFVVADNCTDRTATAAREKGAVVYTRSNKKQVGKGYALRYLLQQIELQHGLKQFDAFLIFDADNLLSPDYISRMNVTVSDGYKAFCGYRNTKNFGSNWLSGAYGLWYLHDSTHLNRSRMWLGTGCAVNGTGFGFTRELLEQLGGWNFHTLTEDIEFSTWCACSGVRIGYCHDAVLYDEQPTSFAVSVRQRTRWTQGGLQVSVKYALRLLRGMLRGGRTAWTCFENATLSLWGYGLSAVSGALALVTAIVSAGWPGAAQAVVLALAGSYASLFAIGALTLVTEWDRIRATTAQKLRAAFAFPVYMLTFLPISAAALFRKFRWDPIEHTAAVSMAELGK